MSGLLPRESVNLDPYNKGLKTLCATKDIEFIDHYNGFLLAPGDTADSYLYKDKLHPNSFGTKKLLKNSVAVYQVTNGGTNSKAPGPVKGFTFVWRSGFPAKGSGPKYCHICSMKGHST